MVDFQWDTEKLSPNQYRIADYIQRNAQDVLFATEQEIADALGLSIASVSRFWRSVGYANMKDWKIRTRQRLDVTPATKMKAIMDKVHDRPQQDELLDVAISNLRETVRHIDADSYRQAVQAFLDAEHIYLYGQGTSQGLVELLRYRLSRLKLRMTHMRGGSELFEDLVHVTQRDLVVVFCFIRMLPECKVILEHAKQAGYRTLLITDRLVSEFSDKADLCLYAGRGEIWEFHSMVAPTFLIENLIVSIGLAGPKTSLSKLEELSEMRKRYAADLPR